MLSTRHVRRSVLSALLLAAAAPLPLWAQSGNAVAAQTTAALGALERPARLSVRDVSLSHALTKLYERSGVPVSFSPSLLPRITVSCDCDTVPVARALERLLHDSGLEFRDIDGHVLVYRPSPIDADTRFQLSTRYAGLSIPKTSRGWSLGSIAAVRLPRAGTIIGSVTEVGTNEPVVNAQVSVDGAGRVLTDEEGHYRIANVDPGQRSVSVTSIGFKSMTKGIEVADGATVTVDFALEISVSKLDAIVVTATGEQRVRELGHVVGHINADSVVKEAPISTLSELLTGRVAGLQVFQAAGTVGGEVHVQIRGANTLALSTEPIVIVDGVRFTNTAARRPFDMIANIKGESTSPLNDLNPNDIESIEVVKGPSAATLYGTDAANGVLVITTKRGRPGPARWNFHVIGSQTGIDTEIPALYHGYGRRPSDGLPYTGNNGNCTLDLVSRAACVQDSVAIYNPLWDADLTLFKSAPRWETGANVSGGLGDLRYYFSGSYEDATGPVGMPDAIADSLASARGELDEDVRRPNALNKLNLRANVASVLGNTLDLRVNTGYTRNATRAIAGSNGVPYVLGLAGSTPNAPYSNSSSGPEQNFSRRSTETTDRFLGNASAQWRAVPWLLARAQIGLDFSQRNHYGLINRGESSFPSDGVVQDDRVRQLSTSADVGVTATGRIGRISARTAVGAQYVRRVDDGLFSVGRDLPPGGTSVGEGVFKDARQSYAETVTLGSYFEETIGLNDRLFLTGALRVDGASAFGQDYNATVYPKASLSWLLSDEPFVPRVPGLDEFRLRYAFGASGQQPLPGWNKPGFLVRQVFVDGAVVNGVGVNTLGNPELRPERVKEHEFGFDVAGLGNRVNIGLTWTDRRTTDQIVSRPLAPGLESIFTNLGLTTQKGFEADVAAQVVDTRLVSWSLRYQFASHRTKLVDLGGASEQRGTFGGWAEGYSLGARFQRPILSFADANGDGILTSTEVQVGPTFEYAGEGIPPRTQSLITAVGLFNQRLRLSALFERRSGFVQNNQWYNQVCQAGHCREAVDLSTPLAEQAVFVATTATSTFNWMAPGDFTRLRELTLTVDVPGRLLRPFRAQSATLNIAGRNLALWSAFDGPDPEAGAVRGISSTAAWGIPLGQTWTVRFDLGY